MKRVLHEGVEACFQRRKEKGQTDEAI